MAVLREEICTWPCSERACHARSPNEENGQGGTGLQDPTLSMGIHPIFLDSLLVPGNNVDQVIELFVGNGAVAQR